jgi:ubiquitin C-terminal hydrolase
VNDLADLFAVMNTNKKSSGTINTKKFMYRIKKLNTLFDNDDHHDSHEFLNWLLNEIHENLLADNKELSNEQPNGGQAKMNPNSKSTFITDLFEGKLVNSTRCLCCESGGTREETFLALSVDIEKNTSLNNCLNLIGTKELMTKRDKFYCENC